VAVADAPLERGGSEGGVENPYDVHHELQQKMNDLVGIIRREGEMREALTMLDDLDERARHVAARGGRRFNPGWHLALDLRNMLAVCRCVALAALERTESRGGHTREDYPDMQAEWRQLNLICSLDDDQRVTLSRKPIPEIRLDLLQLFERSELAKYLTEPELARLEPEPVESGSDQS
jgi:succinate dehydrogenase / fumarate reductase, flavoprotein subunit